MVNEAQVTEYLRQHPLPDMSDPISIKREPADFSGQRFRVSAGSVQCILKAYEPSAIESARREAAGLKLAGNIGLSPSLLRDDETGTALGGPILIAEAPAGKPLGTARMTDEQVQDWVFLLLTLHHLPADVANFPSSMSPDATTWWRRTQASWEACKSLYTAGRYRPLMEVLTKLHAIVGARIEARRDLWNNVPRRLCHGSPVPASLFNTGARLMLTEWEGFGQGDAAMEFARAAGLAALAGDLDPKQYVRFIADYLAGMRDLRDATLESRIQVFASVLPMGFCFVMLTVLAEDKQATADERDAQIAQVERALTWIHDTLGVELGDTELLLAPLA
jgi:Phosphotransferase enzyme family